MSRLQTALILAGALALGLVVGPRFAPASAGDVVTRAVWKDIFDSPAALANGVDAIALVTADSTEPGRVADSDNDGGPTSFVLNHFTVTDAVKGELAAGDRIIVEQTAERHADGEVVGIDSDGGAYTPGQEYLLYLQRQPGTDYWYVVSYQGRYNIDGGRLVGVHAHDAVVTALQFKPLAEALTAVRGTLNTGIVKDRTD
jgi:hypothetical protein